MFVQSGEASRDAASAAESRPWMLAPKALPSSLWHLPQVAAMDDVTAGGTAGGRGLPNGASLDRTATLQAIAEDPASRALFMFPTKALAQDQLAELHELAEALSRQAGTDGGDEEKAEGAGEEKGEPHDAKPSFRSGKVRAIRRPK